jgi:hypothetical protein
LLPNKPNLLNFFRNVLRGFHFISVFTKVLRESRLTCSGVPQFKEIYFLPAEEKRQKRKEQQQQQQQQLQQQQQQQVQQPPQMRTGVPGTVPTRTVGTAPPSMQTTPQSGLPGHSPGK